MCLSSPIQGWKWCYVLYRNQSKCTQMSHNKVIVRLQLRIKSVGFLCSCFKSFLYTCARSVCACTHTHTHTQACRKVCVPCMCEEGAHPRVHARTYVCVRACVCVCVCARTRVCVSPHTVYLLCFSPMGLSKEVKSTGMRLVVRLFQP